MGASKGSDAYAQWVEEWIERGFEPYIISFMFKQLGGSASANLEQMQHLIEYEYQRYLTRVVRKPRASSCHDSRPIWILMPDLPVYKRQKQTLRSVLLNGGRHFQGFALEPFRRREPLQTIKDYFRRRSEGGLSQGIDHVDLQPITHDLAHVAEYTFKSIHRGRFADDNILICPKDRSEL